MMKREQFLCLIIAFFVFQSCKNDNKGTDESKKEDVSIVPAITEIQQEEINDSIKLLFGGNYYFGIVAENSEGKLTSKVDIIKKGDSQGLYGSLLFYMENDIKRGDSVAFKIAENAGMVFATNVVKVHKSDSLFGLLKEPIIQNNLKNKFGAMFFDSHHSGNHKAFHGISKVIVLSNPDYNKVILKMVNPFDDSTYLMRKLDCYNFLGPESSKKYFHLNKVSGFDLKLITDIKINQANHSESGLGHD